jgi:hypothetical protein
MLCLDLPLFDVIFFRPTGHYVRDITLFNQNISSVYHIVHCTCDLNILGTGMDALVLFLGTRV